MLIVAVGGGGSHGSSSPTALLLVGIFFTIIGSTQAVNPRLLWRMNRWRYKNPDANEPSAKGFAVQRVLGGVFAVIGVALVVTALAKM